MVDQLINISSKFPRYKKYNPIVPVWCVTPNHPGSIHRFYDTPPFSPSGKYLGLTRFHSENRIPQPGDTAEILLVNLETGKIKIIAKTQGWDTQLGAQVQWGSSDHELYYNDVDTNTWSPFGIKIDPFSGEKKKLGKPIYMISPDGDWGISPNLTKINISQPGYGVRIPDKYITKNATVTNNDGLYFINTNTGKAEIKYSFRRIIDTLSPAFNHSRYKKRNLYGFHAKWNPQGSRIMFVLRWVPRSLYFLPGRIRQFIGLDRLDNLITIDLEEDNLHLSLPDTEWSKGGNHPTWCPDGENILMNLRINNKNMRFIQIKFDGTNLKNLSESITGSGHPTMHPNGHYILTDAYANGPMSFNDGSVPLRWINLDNETEKQITRIRTEPEYIDRRKQLRVDPHPAWDKSFQWIAFNACGEDGKRRVFIANLSSLL